eukprot:Polyplicarium_translucidae@DN2414_c0_g1_i3.p2
MANRVRLSWCRHSDAPGGRHQHVELLHHLFAATSLDTLEKMERGEVASSGPSSCAEPVDLKHRLLRDLVIEDVLVHANPVAEVEAATEIESESSLNFDARCSD